MMQSVLAQALASEEHAHLMYWYLGFPITCAFKSCNKLRLLKVHIA